MSYLLYAFELILRPVEVEIFYCRILTVYDRCFVYKMIVGYVFVCICLHLSAYSRQYFNGCPPEQTNFHDPKYIKS